jgi:hypothetical protein
MVRNCNRVNAFADASYTYWLAGEDGLTIATNGILSSGVLYFAQESQNLSPSFSYQSGFKAGLGIVGDHEWVLRADYTWFRGRNTKSSGAPLTGTALTAGVPTGTAASGSKVWAVSDWFLQGTTGGQALSGSSVSSVWRLSMDLVDATFSRPFYQGRWITVTPFGGLRGAFIRQSMDVSLTENITLFSGDLPLQPIGSRNHSNSWAVGPRLGCETQVVMPKGFRFGGDLSASLLFTRYTSVKHSEDMAATTFNPGPYTASYKNYDCLRAAAELGLGVGWGSYFSDQDYHFGLSADYDFMIFWSRNIMRQLLDSVLTGTASSSSDLYLHGLTVTGRFDF